jgi:hypothetical protein
MDDVTIQRSTAPYGTVKSRRSMSKGWPFMPKTSESTPEPFGPGRSLPPSHHSAPHHAVARQMWIGVPELSRSNPNRDRYIGCQLPKSIIYRDNSE